MLRFFCCCLLLFLFIPTLFSQVPQAIQYQAVARDASGGLLVNQSLDVRFTIREGSPSGTNVYVETHATSTNDYGLFTLEIGTGTAVTGSLSGIAWSGNPHFLKVELDPGGGFINMGTFEFLSVPYSLYARRSAKANAMDLSDLQDVDANAPAVGETLIWNGTNWVPGTDGDSDPSNEIQTLSLSGSSLSISGGNSVSLPASGSSEWATNGNHIYNTNTGKVGIGTPSPITAFHISDGRRVLFGIDTLGNGDKLMFLPDLHAFRVGSVATGAASTYWNRDSIGLYSFASGYNTRAQGFGATAMGRDTEATNSYAFASGFFSNADGQYSTAMGFNTDALALGATALGYSSDAEENYSFAAGYFAEAQAIYSVAIGNSVQAQSYASMAVGRYNVGGGSATSWIGNDPIFEIGIGTGPSTRENAVTVRKDGRVGIGTTLPASTLHIVGETRIGSAETLNDGGSFLLDFEATLRPATNGTYSLGNSSNRWGTVYAINGTINTSDLRDKDNVKDLNYGLEEVMQLRPVSFRWKEGPERGAKLGLIAQEVQQVIGEVVLDHEWIRSEETGEWSSVEAERMGLFYSDLIPVLIKGMQEQQQMIEELKAEVKALRSKQD